MQPHPRSPVATAFTLLWVFLRETEDRAPVTLASSLPCLQSEIKVLTRFCKTEPRLGVTAEWGVGGGGQGAAYFFPSGGGSQRGEHCETTHSVSPQSRSLFGELLTVIMAPFAQEVLGREEGLVTFLPQECVHTKNKGDATVAFAVTRSGS